MMKNLPPLTRVIDRGPEGGFEFERLIKALLTNFGFLEGFDFEPGATYRDRGIDGIVKENYPGLKCPVVFQFKWLEGPINRGTAKQQIKKSFKGLVDSGVKFNSYVLVTPDDLTYDEDRWLKKLPSEFNNDLKITHYGRTKIKVLLDKYPALKKYYYGEQVPGVTKDLKVIEKDYRKTIIREVKHLNFIGLPKSIYESRQQLDKLELANIYIPLNFSFGKDSSKSITLQEILNKSKPVVILGDVGSGKSTLVKYLALIHSLKLENEIGTEIKGKVPFIIPIREFVRKQQESKHEAFNFIHYLLYVAKTNFSFQEIDESFFIALLALGKAIVLFDGLDEVASEIGRNRIAKDIIRLYDRYPYCSIWVTSRIVGYTVNVKIGSELFDHYYLAPVTPRQVKEFIKKWYEIQIPQDETLREERIQSLQKAIDVNPGVQSLKTNPLLLTMMSLMHWSIGTLPENRARLYEKCIELFLKTWQEERCKDLGIKNPLEDRELKYDHQLKLLAAVAFYIQEKNRDITDEDTRGVIERQELEKVLFSCRIEHNRMSEEKAKEDIKIFIEYLCERPGLLIEKKNNREEEDVFEFAHLSFLEYLCACQIVENKSKFPRNYVKKLLAYLDNSAWEEPLLLSLSLFTKAADTKVINDFTKAVFKGFKNGRHANVWFLMGRAVRDNVDFNNEDIEQITWKIIEIWLKGDESNTAFSILNEIVQSSKRGKDILKEVINIKENIKNNPPGKAFEWLYLYKNLYGIDSLIPGIIAENKKYDLLPYLPVYRNHTALSEFIGNRLKEKHWLIYYNSAADKTSENLDKLLKTRLNPIELKGYLISSWLKICAAFQERNRFLDLSKIGSNTGLRPDEIRCDFGVYAGINYPLNLYHYFTQCSEKTNPSTITNKRFLYEDGGNHVQLRGIFLAYWISEGIEKILKTFEKNQPNSQMSPGERENVRTKIKDFSIDFSRNFSLDLSAFLHLISLDFSQDSNLYSSRFNKDINLWLNRDFNRYFKKYFYQEFSQYFSRYSISEFSRFLNLDLNRDSSDYPYFWNYLNDLFQERYKERLNWGELTKENSQRVCKLFVEEFQKGNREFIDKFLNHLYVNMFYSEFEVSFHAAFPSSQSFPGEKNVPDSHSYSLFPMETALVIPFTFNFVLTGALTHYVLNLLANLNTTFHKKKEIVQSEISDAIDDFTRKNPFWLYLINFSWDFYSKDFNEHYKYLEEGEERNLALAAFVVNAAKVSLVAGMHCKGKEWEITLKEAEKSNHPFVQISLTLYKLCNFIDTKDSSKKLRHQFKQFKKSYPDYYKLIGIR